LNSQISAPFVFIVNLLSSLRAWPYEGPREG
jgi:hypothetical protein